LNPKGLSRPVAGKLYLFYFKVRNRVDETFFFFFFFSFLLVDLNHVRD
jgi:hypothetical protein